MRALGRSVTMPLQVPTGRRRIVELLPVAHALSDQLTTVALDEERSHGRESSCRPGCGACCRQLVALSVVEAQGLAELVATLPPERQDVIRERFRRAVTTLERAGLLDARDPAGNRQLVARHMGSVEASVRDLGHRYFAQQIACPFLEHEACSIYEDRPSVCREYHVTSPAERCAQLYQAEVDRVPIPQRVGDLLMHAASNTEGLPIGKIPLTLSLEWSEANGQQLSATHDGMGLFETMLAES